MNIVVPSHPHIWNGRKWFVVSQATENGQELLKIEPDHNIQITDLI